MGFGWDDHKIGMLDKEGFSGYVLPGRVLFVQRVVIPPVLCLVPGYFDLLILLFLNGISDIYRRLLFHHNDNLLIINGFHATIHKHRYIRANNVTSHIRNTQHSTVYICDT